VASNPTKVQYVVLINVDGLAASYLNGPRADFSRCEC